MTDALLPDPQILYELQSEGRDTAYSTQSNIHDWTLHYTEIYANKLYTLHHTIQTYALLNFSLNTTLYMYTLQNFKLYTTLYRHRHYLTLLSTPHYTYLYIN